MSVELTKLIERGKELMSESYDSPGYKIWKTKAFRFVQNNYDMGMYYAFSQCFSTTIAFDPYDVSISHREEMKNAVQFLQELQDEPVEEQKPEPKPESKERRDPAPFNLTINANPTNTNTLELNIDASLKVQHVVECLIEEVEKMPESEEKRSMIQKLKDLTTNPTFAQITGTVLAEFLKRIGQ